MGNDMKTCTKCGETKELTEFHRNKQSKDGRRPNCKVCALAQVKQIEDGKRGELREYRRKYREANPTYFKEYREKNKDRIRERRREYYQDNKDKIREHSRKYRETHPEYQREHYLENKDRILERQRKYYQNNKDRIKKYRKGNQDKLRTYSARRRIARRGSLSDADVTLSSRWRRVISKMPCYYCGTDDTLLKYHVDHRIPVAKGGDDSWVNLVRACEPCNFSKSAKTDAEFFGWR